MLYRSRYVQDDYRGPWTHYAALEDHCDYTPTETRETETETRTKPCPKSKRGWVYTVKGEITEKRSRPKTTTAGKVAYGPWSDWGEDKNTCKYSHYTEAHEDYETKQFPCPQATGYTVTGHYNRGHSQYCRWDMITVKKECTPWEGWIGEPNPPGRKPGKYDTCTYTPIVTTETEEQRGYFPCYYHESEYGMQSGTGYGHRTRTKTTTAGKVTYGA
ncbi:MAG: hypothetical protein V6Z86_05165 [Hyphomicrobiales bacterium]